MNRLKILGYSLSFFSGQAESFGEIASVTGMNSKGNYFFDASSAINDRLYASKELGSLRLSEERVVREFKKIASDIDWSKPQFIYINFQAAHFPYSYPDMPLKLPINILDRSDISLDNKKQLRETYLNAVANADSATEQVYDIIKSLNLLSQTAFYITADHGESLFDDGTLGHGTALNDYQTKIPFLTNVKGINLTNHLGQNKIAEVIIKSSSDTDKILRDVGQEHAVFQLIGDLSKPSLIGTVSKSFGRITLNLSSRIVHFENDNTWLPLKTALNTKKHQHQVEDIIYQWNLVRWQHYLDKTSHEINKD